MVMSLIPAVILFGYTAWRWPTLEAPFRTGLLFISIFLLAQRFYDLIMTLLRSDKRFDVLSEVTVLNALGMLAIVFVFVWPFNIYGLMIGSATVTFACLAYILCRKPYRFCWYWNNRELFQQLKLALPLLAISFLATFYKSLDKILIAKYLGFADVGLYSIAMMITSLIYAFPMMFSNVLYPHTLEKYGQGQSSDAIAKHLHHPALILSVAVPFLCGIAVILVPVLIKFFLPKFEAGIAAMNVYMIGIFFMLLAQFSSNVLTTLDKYWINIPILIAASALNFLTNLLFIRLGFGLVGVAWGTTLSFFFYGAAMFMATDVYVESLLQGFKRLGLLSGISSVIFLGAFLFTLLPLGEKSLVSHFLKAVIFAFFSTPFFIYLEKKLSIFATLTHFRAAPALSKTSPPPFNGSES